MGIRVVKHYREHKWSYVFIDRHPLIGQQYSCASRNINTVMIIIYQLLCLLGCANGNGLVWVDLVEIRWAGHEMILEIRFRLLAYYNIKS